MILDEIESQYTVRMSDCFFFIGYAFFAFGSKIFTFCVLNETVTVGDWAGKIRMLCFS